jgi:hypothetical protein
MTGQRRARLAAVLLASLFGLPGPAARSASGPEPVPIFPGAAWMNAALATQVPGARLAAVHLQVTDRYPANAPVFYASDRDLHLGTLWVDGDPRRTPGLDWNFDERRGDLPTLVDGSVGTLPMAATRDMARFAVEAWTADCFDAEFRKVPYPPFPGGENVEWTDDYYLGAEPTPFRPGADIVFGGGLPAATFDAIFGPNGANVLAFTVTFAHWDPRTGRYTDIDGDGNLDAWWSEIFFNERFYWGDLPQGSPRDGRHDVATVALHEAGHAFGLGHFGRTFDTRNFFQIADYNIMTSVYIGPLRVIGRTARAGFCSLFADWH